MILFGIIFGALVTCIVALCYIVTIAFTLWMIIDAGKQDRFWWLTLIIGLPIIGPAAYYFTEKKHEYVKAPVHHVHESETEEQHEKAPKKKKTRRSKRNNESFPVENEDKKEEVQSEEKQEEFSSETVTS